MKAKILNLYKLPGETPLQCLNRFRIEHPAYSQEKLSYLGRLDPLAEGVLLVAVGEENKNREKYLSLPKEYEVTILFGVSTDTYDVLGLITNTDKEAKLISQKEIEMEVLSFKELKTQAYPPYSSKTVEGEPLWKKTREGTLENIKIPSRVIEIYKVEMLDFSSVSSLDLLRQIENDIAPVQGDFRQSLILKRWKDFLTDPANRDRAFQIVKINISCGSGAYMRGLAHLLGVRLGSNALALHIERTKVGDFRAK